MRKQPKSTTQRPPLKGSGRVPCTLLLALVVFLAARITHSATNDFICQTIVLPEIGSTIRFVDVDADRRLDLFAIDPVNKRLLIHRQRTSGFTNAPDQIISLPRQTGWIGLHEVDAHPGLELLLSTADGLVYHRQSQGVFESDRRTLIKAEQVFTNDDSPSLVFFASNAPIPVISSSAAVLFQRNAQFEWAPGQPVTLEAQRSGWFVEPNQWSIGPTSSRTLRVQRSFGLHQQDKNGEAVNTEAIGKLTDEMKKAAPRYHLGTNQMDLNADGRKDLLLWQTFVGLDPRTDAYVFLCGADGKLPERPTQVLHCRGFPIPIGTTKDLPSLAADLKGDGTHVLVLIELKSALTSADSLIDMVLSGGLECALVLRYFDRGLFSGNPNRTIPIRTALPITTLAPVEELDRWPFFICGDFNGDGRPDLVVKRTPTQWSILASTADGRWFTPQPVMTLEIPAQGSLQINDLNGDGCSDVFLRPENDPRLFICLAPSLPTKGKSP